MTKRFSIWKIGTRQYLREIFYSRDSFYIVLLIFLPMIFYWNFLFAVPAPLIFPNSDLGTDLPREVWPLANYVTNAIHETGKIPLWRTYQLSGAPLVGHPTAPIFYPIYWLVLILPIPLALNLCAVIHIAWMGIGVYLFMRSLNLKPEASFFGAIIFSQTPKWVAHLGGGHLFMLSAIAWWPWIWLGIENYWKSNNKIWGVLTGVGFCAQAINHGTIFIITIIGVGLRCFWHIKINRSWLKQFLSLTIILGMIIIGLGAIQLFPFIELLPFSNRANMSQADAFYGSLPPVALLNVLFPPTLKFPEFYLYPGAIVIFLVLIIIFQGIKEKRNIFWITLATIGILMSLGSYTPIYRAFINLFPNLTIMRIPTRWWIFTIFSFSILCAHAIEKWQNHNLVFNKKSKIIGIILLTLYATTTIITLVSPSIFPFSGFSSFITLLICFLLLLGKSSRIKYAMLCLFIIFDLWIVGNNQIIPQKETDLNKPNELINMITSTVNSFDRVFSPYGGLDTSSIVKFGMNVADGYDSFQLNYYSQLINDAIGCDYTGYSVSVPPMQTSPDALKNCATIYPKFNIFRLLNIRYILLPNNIKTIRFPKVWGDDNYSLFDIGHGFGRAFGVEKINIRQKNPCEEELLNLDLSKVAVLEENPSQGNLNFKHIDVLNVEKMTNGEKFSVNVYEPSLLVRSETWAPGWDAYVKGEKNNVVLVDCALQGVWLDKGTYDVIFVYEPTGYEIGKWVSLITFCLVSAIIVIMTAKRIIHHNNTTVS